MSDKLTARQLLDRGPVAGQSMASHTAQLYAAHAVEKAQGERSIPEGLPAIAGATATEQVAQITWMV